MADWATQSSFGKFETSLVFKKLVFSTSFAIIETSFLIIKTSLETSIHKILNQFTWFRDVQGRFFIGYYKLLLVTTLAISAVVWPLCLLFSHWICILQQKHKQRNLCDIRHRWNTQLLSVLRETHLIGANRIFHRIMVQPSLHQVRFLRTVYKTK